MQKNIYISNLDTSFGYHIAQHYRQDHLQADPQTRIVGSASTELSLPWISHTINFQKHPQLACRVAMDCSTIILDLRSASHEAETIIKFLRSLKEEDLKTTKIIGISSLMTWDGLKAHQLQSENQDKDVMLNAIVDENSWRTHQWADKDYPKRVPNVLWNKCYQLENLLLTLNKNKNIKASVLAVGLLYGKDNQMLQSDIFRALSGQSLSIYGNGKNQVPLLHIDSFLQGLEELEQSQQQYTVLKDTETFSQQEVKKCLTSVTGSLSKCQNQDLMYATEQECLWNIQSIVERSNLFSNLKYQKKFLTYCQESLLLDLCQYTQWTPNQCFLFVENFQPELLEQLTSSLSQKITIIAQETIEKLNLQLIAKNMPPEEQEPKKPARKGTKMQPEIESQPPQYSEAINQLLSPLKYTPFVVACSSNMKEYLTQTYFTNGYLEIVTEVNDELEHRQVVYNSLEWYDLMKIEPLDMSSQNVNEQPFDNSKKQTTFGALSGKKDDKLILTTQYLMDNVLGAISEARFQLKRNNQDKEPTLRGLIDELKAIYARGNYQSCLNKENTQVCTSSKPVK